AAARIEPDVEDVGLLAEPLAAAPGAPGGRRQQLRLAAEIPLLDAPPLAEEAGHVLDHALVQQELAAALTVERHDRHAPHALARERPVGPVRDHVEDALLAPGRDPLHLAPDGLQRPLAQVLAVEGGEPLLGGAEE